MSLLSPQSFRNETMSEWGFHTVVAGFLLGHQSAPKIVTWGLIIDTNAWSYLLLIFLLALVTYFNLFLVICILPPGFLPFLHSVRLTPCLTNWQLAGPGRLPLSSLSPYQPCLSLYCLTIGYSASY